MGYKSNNNVVYSCKYHVVFCPKYRRPVLVNGVDVRLKELITETCERLKVEIIEMEIMPDHVHLLMEVDPRYGIHKAVKQIKGYSSRIFKRRISLAEIQNSELMDKQLFCFNRRRCSIRCHETIY